MRASTLAKFIQFLIRVGEGDVFDLYLDGHKDASGAPAPIVTTAIGCALFSVEEAIALSWVEKSDGVTPASADDVRAAWAAVVARKDLAGHGAGAFENVTTIRLTQDSHDALVNARIATFEAELRPVFPNYDTVPDAAEEGIVRLTWATGGANFKARWPKFSAAFLAEEWAVCASECAIQGLAGEPNANLYEKELFESLGPAPVAVAPTEPAPPPSSSGVTSTPDDACEAQAPETD